jgi:AcrR family transcriptional regulator
MPANQAKDRKSATRERLLSASLKAFGHNDYQAVSTRQIVEQAQANISAISYHFGGKQQLYLATAEYLAQSIRHNMQHAMRSIPANPEASECREHLTQFIHALAHDILEGELSADAAGFIFREQLNPTAAFDILYRELMEPMQSTYAQLLSCALYEQPDDKQIKLMTHALLGQILIFRVGQTTILRRLDARALTTPDVTQIATMITQNTLAAIDAQQQQD